MLTKMEVTDMAESGMIETLTKSPAAIEGYSHHRWHQSLAHFGFRLSAESILTARDESWLPNPKA